MEKNDHPMTTHVPLEVKEMIERLAAQQDTKPSVLIRKLITKYLNEQVNDVLSRAEILGLRERITERRER